MTPGDVHKRVALITRIAVDDEAAHGEEDALHADVLRAIASGDIAGTVAVQCAAIALTTADIDFSRWCA